MIYIDTTGKEIYEYLEADKWYALYHHDEDSTVTEYDLCKTLLLFTPKNESDLPTETLEYFKEYTKQNPHQICTVGKVNLFLMSFREESYDVIDCDEDNDSGYYVIIAHDHSHFFELTHDEVLTHVVMDEL